MNLKGQVAVVTGGATGSGRASAGKRADRGAAVMVADINDSASAATAAEVAEIAGRSACFRVDVTDVGACSDLAAKTLEVLGPADILINNAGVAGAPNWQKRSFSTEEDWKMTYRVNVIGMSNIVTAFEPQMAKRRSGRVVNIASIAGREGRPSLPHYSASKAAVISLTQSTALELARYNITVNAICPGLLWTPMWEQVGERYAREVPAYAGMSARQVFDVMIADRIPMKSEQTPEDIAETVVFFTSYDAKNITGQALNVDGGLFMR
ncbi:MAG: SDR family NAD(P)-dependent oxidoreductase [Chloroflexi bacterium]|nr:SDR family NAD(P)-dependent oxidoreductase [Chloroflexota bacterium]